MPEAERVAARTVHGRRVALRVRRPVRGAPEDVQSRLAAFPTYEEALRPLARLVALERVKELFHEIYCLRKMNLRRGALGLKTEPQALHMIFSGHPGTGKTTAARLLGTCLKSIGLLSYGHFTEVERADLVGEYVGHTAQKTRAVLQRAKGGVLFIDEAYSLMRGGERDFGREAIDTLVRGMEEAKSDLVLIFAGYPAEMGRFMKANPGLESRVSIHLDFPDYTAGQLLDIVEVLLREREYRLSPDARYYLKGALERRCREWGANRGNARLMRNLVEKGVRRHALRLEATDHASRAALMTLTWADLSDTGLL